MSRVRFNLSSDEQGAQALELALLLGTLVLIVFTSIDLAFYLRTAQVANTLSAELGNISVRECFNVCHPPQADGDIQESRDSYNCLQDNFSTIKRVANKMIPGSEIRLRYYYKRIESPSNPNATGYCQPPTIADSSDDGWESGEFSEFNDFRDYSPGRVGSEDYFVKPYVVIAEVKVPYHSVTPFGEIFLKNSAVYNATSF